MDISQALKNAENSLRDYISFVLFDRFGNEWEQRSGVSSDRIAKWYERKAAERARQRSGAVDERLIYYADFYDLKTILKKHWHFFNEALGEFKTVDVWLSELEKLRDPDAHRRELLPHQKHLIIGLSGEIRTKIARFRSNLETSEAYYPRFEFVADNLGNSWKIGDNDWVNTGLRLRPGDLLEFVVTATDPNDEPLKYQFNIGVGSPGFSRKWTDANTFNLTINEDHIGKMFIVSFRIKSGRKYHARSDHDDDVDFVYEVLPPRV